MQPTLGEIDFFDPATTLEWPEFECEIQDFIARLGLRHYSFLEMNRGRDTDLDAGLELRTNYLGDWIERYCARRYDQLDPVCQLGRTARSPFTWGTNRFLSDFEKRQRRVFWEARDFGILYGLSIPVRGVDGSIGLVSFTAENQSVLRDVMREHGGALHMAAHQISDHLIPRRARKLADDTPLSPRERECLIWVAEGMTSDEIADRMFLSVSAINYHLGNATKKLTARNRHHAALIALSKNLI